VVEKLEQVGRQRVVIGCQQFLQAGFNVTLLGG